MDGSQTKRLRGFAALSPEKRREISSRGGRSVDPAKRAYSRDPELAMRAGRKGGISPRKAKGEDRGVRE